MKERIIICGHSRAGTTLLHEVMRQEMAGEGWTFYDEERPFTAADSYDGRIVTKRPLDVFRRDNIRALSRYSDVRVLLCIRDPRAMLTSKHPAVSWDYFYHAHAQYMIRKPGDASLANPGLLAVHDAIMAMHRDPEIKTEVVRYEDTLERAYQPGQAPAQLAVAMNGDREIDRSRLDAWREHMPRLEDQFRRFPRLIEVMDAYGYDPENLRGVASSGYAKQIKRGVGV